MKTITFYSYKGGVGRTLALSNIATQLAEFGKKVFIIDFDFEAPGVHYKFQNINRHRIKRGIVDYIYQYQQGNRTSSKIADFTIKPRVGKQSQIHVLPAGNNLSKEYWNRLSMIDWHELFYKENSEGFEFFLDLKNKIQQEFNPDFLLIDSRTGITDISGITISILPDEIVMFSANNIESLEGTAQVIYGITSSENNLIKEAPKITLALCRIPYRYKNEDRYFDPNIKTRGLGVINDYLKNRESRFSLDDLIIIHSDRELEIQEKFKIGQYSFDAESNIIPNISNIPPQDNISQDYLILFEKLTKNDLSAEEVQQFHRRKASQYCVEASENTENEVKKIQFLKQAIELDNLNEDAYGNLGALYLNLHLVSDAESIIDSLLKINKQNPFGNLLKGYVHLNRKEYDLALDRFTKLIETYRWAQAIQPTLSIYSLLNNNEKVIEYSELLLQFGGESSDSYNSLANAYRFLRKFDEAKSYIYKSLQLNPKNALAYGTLAEINADLENVNEFYKNFELSLIFGIDFYRVFNEESVYEKFYNEPRFKELMQKYNYDIGALIPSDIKKLS